MLLAFCEILAFKSFKCWVRWKRKSRKCCTHFFLFWKHFDIFEIPRKVRFGIGKGWPWISVRQDAMYQLCGVVKMCVKFTNGWMNLAISHDVRNIHSYFGKGRRQKHNLLLSCPQATHTQAWAGSVLLFGGGSKSFLINCTESQEARKPCVQKKHTHSQRRNQLRYKLKFRDTHTALQKKKQSMIFPCIFLFTLHAQFYVHELFISLVSFLLLFYSRYWPHQIV